MPKVTPEQIEQKFLALLGKCRDNPVLFARRVLGWSKKDVNELVEYQKEVAMLVATYKVIVVPAGHSVGKSRLAALIILWWMFTRPRSLVLVTAPSAFLVGSVIFKEIRLAMARSLIPLGGEISKSPRISPQIYRLGQDGSQCLGISVDNAVNAHGQHNKNTLVVCDESSGIDSYIWESITSWNFSKMVLFGNPVTSEGDFPKYWARAMHPQEQLVAPNKRTVTRVISTLESPHIHLEKSPCGLADKGFLDEVIKTYGKDSLYWKTRIEVDPNNPFPTQSHEQLINQEWLDLCPTHFKYQSRSGPGMAVDISKGTGRDRTVIMIGDDMGITSIWASNTTKLDEAARLVRDKALAHGIPQERIVYDAGGWAGSDFGVHLRSLGLNNCIGYHGNDSGGFRHKNRRTLAAWRIRQRLDPTRPLPIPVELNDPYRLVFSGQPQPEPKIQPGYSIPYSEHWDELRKELLALRYTYDEGTKIWLEDKSQMQHRLGKSPDLCDTMLMLTTLWQGFD